MLDAVRLKTQNGGFVKLFFVDVFKGERISVLTGLNAVTNCKIKQIPPEMAGVLRPLKKGCFLHLRHKPTVQQGKWRGFLRG